MSTLSTQPLLLDAVFMSVQPSVMSTAWTIEELVGFPKAVTDSFNAGDYERINSVLSKYVTEGKYDDDEHNFFFTHRRHILSTVKQPQTYP